MQYNILAWGAGCSLAFNGRRPPDSGQNFAKEQPLDLRSNGAFCLSCLPCIQISKSAALGKEGVALAPSGRWASYPLLPQGRFCVRLNGLNRPS